MNSVLERLQREMGESLRDLDAAQTQLRPSGDLSRWSIKQIVEHLMLTYSSTAEVFATRISRGSATKARPSVQQWLGQLMLVRCGYFPRGRKAPAAVCPAAEGPAISGLALTKNTEGLLERFDVLADEAEMLFGGRRAISHAVLGPLCVADWRRFHLIHGEHHLKQVRAIRVAHGL